MGLQYLHTETVTAGQRSEKHYYLLTDAEKDQQNVPRILAFGYVCSDSPKYPPDQVNCVGKIIN